MDEDGHPSDFYDLYQEEPLSNPYNVGDGDGGTLTQNDIDELMGTSADISESRNKRPRLASQYDNANVGSGGNFAIVQQPVASGAVVNDGDGDGDGDGGLSNEAIQAIVDEVSATYPPQMPPPSSVSAHTYASGDARTDFFQWSLDVSKDLPGNLNRVYGTQNINNLVARYQSLCPILIWTYLQDAGSNAVSRYPVFACVRTLIPHAPSVEYAARGGGGGAKNLAASFNYLVPEIEYPIGSCCLLSIEQLNVNLRIGSKKQWNWGANRWFYQPQNVVRSHCDAARLLPEIPLQWFFDTLRIGPFTRIDATTNGVYALSPFVITPPHISALFPTPSADIALVHNRLNMCAGIDTVNLARRLTHPHRFPDDVATMSASSHFEYSRDVAHRALVKGEVVVGTNRNIAAKSQKLNASAQYRMLEHGTTPWLSDQNVSMPCVSSLEPYRLQVFVDAATDAVCANGVSIYTVDTKGVEIPEADRVVRLVPLIHNAESDAVHNAVTKGKTNKLPLLKFVSCDIVQVGDPPTRAAKYTLRACPLFHKDVPHDVAHISTRRKLTYYSRIDTEAEYADIVRNQRCASAPPNA